MNLNAYSLAEGIATCESPVSQEPTRTYVMQGRAQEKCLDIYHLIFAPTHACNLRCRHCYLPDHVTQLFPREHALRLVDEWSEMVIAERGEYGGIFHIKGGEPFVVPYLWDITDRLVELRSLRLWMTTNGTFTKEGIFNRLRDCNDALDSHVVIVVSLDGATEETHSLLRGRGQFNKTLRFLEGLRRNGITLHLNCVLHMGNIHELREYVNLAKEYGASQVNFLSFVPRGIGSTFRQFQVPHLEVYRLLSELYKNADTETRGLLAGSLPHILQREQSGECQTSHECVAAYRGMFYITPDGNVYTCPNIVFPEFSVGNVFKSGLKELSERLDVLYERLALHSRPFTCTGEKILYKKTNDVENQISLQTLENEISLKRPKERTSPIDLSYCFSRNY